MSDALVKLIIVAAYMLGLVLLGVVASRRMTSSREYFAANKQLGFLATAFSARATGESAWLLLGLTGLGATVGIYGLWVVLGETLGVALAWLWMARPFKRLTDRYDSITVPDYLESRFRDDSQLIRKVSAFVLVVFITIYVSAQIDATGTAFESFLGWDYYTGAIIGFLVVLVYITSGGFLAVAWSDVVQGSLMFFGLVLLPIAGLVHAGGADAVISGIEAIDPSMLSLSHGGWSGDHIMRAVGMAVIGVGFLGSPQVFVRFIALKGESELRNGTLVAITFTILTDTGAILAGLVGRHLLTEPGDDLAAVLGNGGQDVLPLMVEHVFPLIIVGIFVAIVLSAIMSTVDSLLVLASSAVVRDWYQQVHHPELPDEALTGKARWVTVALAGGALAIALTVAALIPGRTVFWFVIFGWSGIAATFCPTMIMSLAWRGLTARGVIAAMITGFASVPLFKFVIFELDGVGAALAPLSELPPAFVLSFIAGIGVSLLDPKRKGLSEDVAADLSDARR